MSQIRKRKPAQDEFKEIAADEALLKRQSDKESQFSIVKLLKRAAIFVIILYSAIPLILFLIPQLGQQVLYMNLYVGRNEVESLKHPETEYQLMGTAVFHIKCDGLAIGMWHVLPKSKIAQYKQDEAVPELNIEENLMKAENIIIYHHGAGSTRATGDHYQRDKFYKVFQSEDYHTITFDYRGFGDSDGWPIEQGLINDSLCVLNWVKERTSQSAKIYFWGHSMGGSIATQSAKKLYDSCVSKPENCKGIDGLVVEGAPANARRAAKDNPIVRNVLSVYPAAILNKAVDASLGDTYLATDRDLPFVKCPVMLMYSGDDDTILPEHGDYLYSLCKKKMNHKNKRVKLVRFSASRGYGHLDVFKAPELPMLIKEFMNKKQNEEFEVVNIQ